MAYMIGVSWENRASLPSRSEKKKDRRLAQDFIVVRRKTRLRFPKLRQGWHGLGCSMVLKERASGFPI